MEENFLNTHLDRLAKDVSRKLEASVEWAMAQHGFRKSDLMSGKIKGERISKDGENIEIWYIEGIAVCATSKKPHIEYKDGKVIATYLFKTITPSLPSKFEASK